MSGSEHNSSQALKVAEDIGGLKSSVSSINDKINDLQEGMTEIRGYLSEGKERHRAFTEAITKNDARSDEHAKRIRDLESKTDKFLAVAEEMETHPRACPLKKLRRLRGTLTKQSGNG